MQHYDFLVIGAGIAGASLAYRLAPHGSVGIFEQEFSPGFHATGRSTATYVRSYGNSVIRALTAASREFFMSPPDGFCDVPLLHPRGNLRFGQKGDQARLEQEYASCAPLVPDLQILGQSDALRLCPALNPDYVSIGLYEPGACDMDVDALLQGYLRSARANGARLHTNARLTSIERKASLWHVGTSSWRFSGRTIINAAGAWADDIARMAHVKPCGITPKRRTVACFAPDPMWNFRRWPLVRNAKESFYFKPFSGTLLVTPADETPCLPCDSQPEEIDLAIALDRLRQETLLAPPTIASSWAGLRSFTANETPVIGFASDQPDFFWLAGLGGAGIQTSPAAGLAAALLITEQPWPGSLTAAGLTRDQLISHGS